MNLVCEGRNDESIVLTMPVERNYRERLGAILPSHLERLLEVLFGAKWLHLETSNHLATLVEMP
jgi:hypothetical protein